MTNLSVPQEKILEALYDCLELKVVMADIEDRDKRLAVLRDKQFGLPSGFAPNFGAFPGGDGPF